MARLSWRTADLYCRSLGTHLVSITTLQENAFIASRLPEFASALIGATDAANEGTWTWRPGNAALGYTGWDTDEPNGVSDAAVKDCAAIDSYSGTWWTLDCETNQGLSFVCEFE